MGPSIHLHDVPDGSYFLLFILEINFEMLDLRGSLVGPFDDHIDVRMVWLHEPSGDVLDPVGDGCGKQEKLDFRKDPVTPLDVPLGPVENRLNVFFETLIQHLVRFVQSKDFQVVVNQSFSFL